MVVYLQFPLRKYFQKLYRSVIQGPTDTDNKGAHSIRYSATVTFVSTSFLTSFLFTLKFRFSIYFVPNFISEPFLSQRQLCCQVSFSFLAFYFRLIFVLHIACFYYLFTLAVYLVLHTSFGFRSFSCLHILTYKTLKHQWRISQKVKTL